LPAGVAGYEELAANAVEMDLGVGTPVRVCALDDLIRMKRAAGRPKDRIELEVLTAVREETDRLLLASPYPPPDEPVAGVDHQAGSG
ncbi:MAG: hypothetical protein ABIW46_06210, partial [Acidimicrobiales bacterium]